MDLTKEEVKAIRGARLDIRTWPYLRWVLLLLGFTSLGVSLWIPDREFIEILHSREVQYARAFLQGLSIGLIIFVVTRWGNEQTKLLLKLALAGDEDGKH